MTARFAYVGVGSNCVPLDSIAVGLEALKTKFGLLRSSYVYRSRAKENSGPKYINLIVGFSTGERWSLVRQALKAIENKAGRVHDSNEVTLDLDLLVMTNQKHVAERFWISLDDLKNEPYVLLPLSELLPDSRHPESENTLTELWQSVRNRFSQLEIISDVGDPLRNLISN